MGAEWVFHERALCGLLWLGSLRHDAWPSEHPAGTQRTPTPAKPPRQRSNDATPCPGRTRTPPGVAWEQAAPAAGGPPPPAPPPPLTAHRGRPRQVDPSQQCGPPPDGA
jgi:hypothetical protein